MKKERCEVCGKKVRMQVYRLTGVCSQRCEEVRTPPVSTRPVSYPFKSGDTLVIGPGVIYNQEEKMINYLGANYYSDGWKTLGTTETGFRVWNEGTVTVNGKAMPYPGEEFSSPVPPPPQPKGRLQSILHKCGECNLWFALDEISGGLVNHRGRQHGFDLCSGSGKVPVV